MNSLSWLENRAHDLVAGGCDASAHKPPKRPAWHFSAFEKAGKVSKNKPWRIVVIHVLT